MLLRLSPPITVSFVLICLAAAEPLRPRLAMLFRGQAQLAAAVLDKLDVGHVTVIGHSMGGEVAVALAERNSERIDRMILIDSPPTADTTFTIITKIYLMPVVGEMLSHFQSDEAIRRGLAQGFAPNFVHPGKVRD